jgi:hypothetical protein
MCQQRRLYVLGAQQPIHLPLPLRAPPLRVCGGGCAAVVSFRSSFACEPAAGSLQLGGEGTHVHSHAAPCTLNSCKCFGVLTSRFPMVAAVI